MGTQEKETKDVVPSDYRDKYKANGGNNGDFIASELSRIAKDGTVALQSVKTENGIDADKWSHMNAGMQRMNLGNTLRAAFLRGETVKVLGREYNLKHIAEDFDGEINETESSTKAVARFVGLTPNDRIAEAIRKLYFPVESKSEKLAEVRKAAKIEKANAALEKAETAHAAKVADHVAARAAHENAGQVGDAPIPASLANKLAKAEKAVVTAAEKVEAAKAKLAEIEAE